MSFDLAGSLRRTKPQRASFPLERRSEALLPQVSASTGSGPELLLDTCVYIDALQGRAPGDVGRLLTLRTVNHSAVALAELTHLFGRLDPAHAGTRAVLGALGKVLSSIQAHRLAAPGSRTWGEAGMLAGLAARLTGRPHGPDLLNDACLLLQAGETGRVLLTRNVRDFDPLQQLAPWTSVMVYQPV